MSNYYITQVELATLFGVRKSYITKLKAQGLFDSCFDEKKLIREKAIYAYENRLQDPTRENQREANASKRKSILNSQEAIEQLEQGEIEQHTHKSIKGNGSIYNDSNIHDLNTYLRQAKNANQKVQIIKDFWIGKISEQKYNTELKLLVYIDDIVRENQKVIKAIRDKCLAIPSKIAPIVAHTDNIAEVQELINNAISDALSELTRLNESI